MSLKPHHIIERMDETRFSELFSECTRKTRHTLESVFSKKRRGKPVSLKSALDRKTGVQGVHAGLKLEKHEKYADELIKAYFYERKPLLKIALDFFAIPNEDGITTEELDALVDAPVEKLDELGKQIATAGIAEADYALYLVYLQVKNAFKLSAVLDRFGEDILEEAPADGAEQTAAETPATPESSEPTAT